MSYFRRKQVIQAVNRKGQVLGEIEKWEAHKKGILHKAFTITLVYKKQIILQHRKHLAFNGFFDATSSSHPLIKKGLVEDLKTSVYKALQREWNLKRKDLSNLYYKGDIYYKAVDKKNNFIEHELCAIFTCKVSKIPLFNPDFAYGFSLLSRNELYDGSSLINSLLAPWVKVMLSQKLI